VPPLWRQPSWLPVKAASCRPSQVFSEATAHQRCFPSGKDSCNLLSVVREYRVFGGIARYKSRKRPDNLNQHTLMKYLVQIMVVVAIANSARAALPQEQIASDAKWLLHLDIAQFRSTQVGSYIFKEIVQKQLSKPLAEIKHYLKYSLDQDKILEQISSITIYGTAYQSPENNSVVIVRTDAELEKVVLGALAGLSLASGSESASVEVKQTQIGNVSFYAIRDDFFFAVQPGKVVMFGKSRAMTEKAAQVLAGRASSLSSSKSFSGFVDMKRAFFFMGVAEGFSAGPELPPQAKLLQMADGGRVVLGENSDRIFLDLALRAKSTEVGTQMQQVIQGLIALSSLGQSENKDVAQMLDSIKVSTSGNVVSVSVEYPVESVIHFLGENKDKLGVRPGRAGF
jgi:hypothetical protein